MLNNYLSSVDFGLGTAQKVTSGSSVKLEKNKSYKISVWVKTINLSSNNADGKFGSPQEYVKIPAGGFLVAVGPSAPASLRTFYNAHSRTRRSVSHSLFCNDR